MAGSPILHDPFDEPRAKIARARKHLNELISAQEAYNLTTPVSVELGTTSDGNPAILLRADKMPDLQCSAIAGDILNNLRCSLDLAVNAACRVNGRTNLSKTYFPIIASEGDWPDVTSGKSNRMKAASFAIKRLVKSFKPWKDGNPIIHALSRLVGLDKHQAIISLATHQNGVVLGGLQVKGPNIASRVQGSAHLRLSRAEPTAVLLFTDPENEILLDGPNQVSVILAFEATGLQPYMGSIDLLHEMGRACEEIVEAFAAKSASGELT